MSTCDLRVRRALGVVLLSIAIGFAAACDDEDPPTPLRDAGPMDAPADAANAADVADTGTDRPVDVASPDGGSSPDSGMIGVNRPERRPFSAALLGQLKVPAGFQVSVYASGLVNPRMIAVAPDGSAYVTSRMAGEVIRLRDGNGDGDAADEGEKVTVASKMQNPDLDGAHGIALRDGKLYVATVKKLLVAPLTEGQPGPWQPLLADLPDGGQHPNRTLAVSPDGTHLYVTIGSSCNACPETNPEHATILRVTVGGVPVSNLMNAQHPMRARDPMVMLSPRLFASGLRNTLGFDWHPTTGELWGSDHGSDGLGNDVPPDELNRLLEAKSYGWPYCWGARQVDPVIEPPSPMTSKQSYCAGTEPMVLGYPAHSAPIGFLFYRAQQFPADYRGDAFVAFRGSWNREQPTGYKVVRVHFENGVPAPLPGQTEAHTDFLSGFLLDGGAAHFGRLAGLAVDGTGALLVAEDDNGVVYRVSHGPGISPDGGADGSAGN